MILVRSLDLTFLSVFAATMVGTSNPQHKSAQATGDPVMSESRTFGGGDAATDAHRQIAGRLVIASHNPGKLREMRELLMPYGIEAVSASELPLAEPEETGTSFAENASIKARAAAAAS